ncbi:Copper-exporting P-type ATPase B [Candidatus Tiddalikarchaeum anstoanum]|nr:Copper-exporting P-type ATPase B [Candidatus Tiddalikarchaeum anstoanum]
MVDSQFLTKGLTTTQVNTHRAIHGLNKLPEKSGKSAVDIFISQFKNPLIYIITIAAIISALLNEYSDAALIGFVIILDSLIGFFQEYKAEKTMNALKHLLNPTARVIRNSAIVNIDASEIVPGDLVILNTGDKIPADGELMESVSLGINEAILTGESEPVHKKIGETVFMGTIILSGRGLIKVSVTGLKTKLGKIAESLVTINEEQTPLQVRLNSFSKSLSIMVLIISFLIFVIGLFLGINIFEMVRLSIVLAIAAIPEGLIIAVTMILVIGMQMILKKKGLVKKLLAVETLGSVTTIATDKTGTLTEGQMHVVKADVVNSKIASYVMALCNNLEDSLEITLWDYVKNALNTNPQELFDKYKRVNEEPFTSEKKFMLTTNIIDGVETGLIKGAPDIIIEFCKLTKKEKEAILSKFEDWARLGLKIIGLAYKEGSHPAKLTDYTWAGLIGIEDPIRPSVKNSIELCMRAGIKTKIITGDFRLTAEKVAKNLGLDVTNGHILEGYQIDKMSEKNLISMIKNVTVFCRVTPEHKLRIITALQKAGEVTAMIGDGVNDAPALKKANIGVTVGGGTDVAQETSSLIMLDSNFKTLVDAVEEGRIIFDNIKKVAAYVLSNSFAEIILLFFSFILGWPAPLTVGQILWIHLICDGPVDISLGFERGEKGIMDEPPKKLNENVLDRRSTVLIGLISSVSAVISLIIFGYYAFFLNEVVLARTLIFTIFSIQTLIYIFAYKSLRRSIFHAGNILSNKPLIGSVILGLFMTLIALYVPFMNNLLNLQALTITEWVIPISVSMIMVILVELVKYSYTLIMKKS